mmetsp:Transcript_13711/g.11670  ORF Transcript_13711/g.11670 Transcript_13711/m.11670 type:complete len:198 (+) Transcript_13711:281-874(+)
MLNVSQDGVHEAYFAIDYVGARDDPRIRRALRELNFFCRAYIDENIPEVPWFPVHLSDLDTFGKLLDVSDQDGGKDHPGFNDQDYLKRREYIAEVSQNYKMGSVIPSCNYNANENGTWAHIWEKLRPLQKQTMCKQFNDNISKFEKAGIYKPDKIPQLQEINEFLTETTGFRLKPVSGILSQREFLNALALRTFCCT